MTTLRPIFSGAGAGRRLAAACVVLSMLVACETQAATRFSRSTGNWTAASWSATSCAGATGASVPANGDDVTICAGNTVTLDTSYAAPGLNSLTVNGTLSIGSNNTARTLTVANDVLISNTGTLSVNTGSNTTHAFVPRGNVTNTGTLNLATDGNSRMTMTFNSQTSGATQTFSGSGTTNLYTLSVNTVAAGGTSNIVDVNGLSNLTFTNGAVSTMTSGTLKLSSAVSIPSGMADPTLPAGTRYWLNNASASMTFAAAITVAAGASIQIDSGTFTSTSTMSVTGSLTNSGTFSTTGNMTVGGLVQNDAGTFSATGATGITVSAAGNLTITGGAVTVGNAANEAIILTSGATTTFSMSGGTLDVAGRITNSAAAGNAAVTISGGTITVGIVGNSQNSLLGAPFYLGSGASSCFTMSGGVIVIQQPSTAGTPREYDVNAAAGCSSVTGGTVQIGNASTAGSPNLQVDSTVPVFNLTLDSTGTPTATLASALTVSNDVTIGTGTTLDASASNFNLSVGHDWINNGAFTQRVATVTFDGASAQTIGGTASTTFNNLTINNTSGGVSLGKDQAVNATLTLTSGTVSTGANTLSIAAAGTVSPVRTTSSAGATNQVFGNVQKAFDATHLSFTYPVGDGTNFTPVTVTFTTLTTAGTLTATTASPATPAADHPDTTGGRSGIDFSKSVNRYFTLNNPTATGTYTVALNYLSTDNDGGASPATFVIARGETCATSTTNTGGRTCNPWGIFTPTTRTSSQAVVGGLLLVSGDRDADFAIGNQTTARFIRPKEFVYSRELY